MPIFFDSESILREGILTGKYQWHYTRIHTMSVMSPWHWYSNENILLQFSNIWEKWWDVAWLSSHEHQLLQRFYNSNYCDTVWVTRNRTTCTLIIQADWPNSAHLNCNPNLIGWWVGSFWCELSECLDCAQWSQLIHIDNFHDSLT